MIFFSKNDIQIQFLYFIGFLKFIVLFFSCCLALCFVYAIAPWSTWELVLMLENRVPIWSLFIIQIMMCWGSVFVTGQAKRKSHELSLTWKFAQGSNHSLVHATRIVSSVQACQTHGQDKITYFSLRFSWWEWSFFVTRKALVRVFPFLTVPLA